VLLKTAVGCTAIIKFVAGPLQPFAVAVTDISACTGLEVVFTGIKDAILPLPLPARPMVVLSLVQAKVHPPVALLKLIAGLATPLHSCWFATELTLGLGLTVIVKF
jgi:hypothetical protein